MRGRTIFAWDCVDVHGGESTLGYTARDCRWRMFALGTKVNYMSPDWLITNTHAPVLIGTASLRRTRPQRSSLPERLRSWARWALWRRCFPQMGLSGS